MPHLVEVAFKGNRKEFFTWDADEPPPLKSAVIVDADRGEDLGTVHSLGELAQKRCVGCAHGCGAAPPPRRALRLATSAEVRQARDVRGQDESARRKGAERVKAHGLVMKMSDAEWQWDKKKLTFYFTAEKRVDFRNLVRDLASLFRARIELNPLRAFDSDHPGTREVMRTAPLLLDHLDEADLEHFAEVQGMLDAAGLVYEVDPTLVRGLDYYTRTLFEFTSDALGAQSGVAGGGRYDRLVEQLGGPPTPGMGWAAGIERILLAGEAQHFAATPIELFIALGENGETVRREAFALLVEARSAGLAAQMELGGRSLKGQLGQAASLGARFVAIVGSGETALRDMQAATQETVPLDTVVHAVLRSHHDL